MGQVVEVYVGFEGRIVFCHYQNAFVVEGLLFWLGERSAAGQKVVKKSTTSG